MIRGDYIRKCRKRMGKTQEALAESSGISLRSIINMEQGKGNPRLSTIFALARALDSDARKLLR